MSSVLKNKSKRKYCEQCILDGIEAVHRGMSVREAARTFKVPKTTLSRYEGHNHHGGKIGHPSLFSDEEEKMLAKLLIRFAEIGSPYNKNHLRTLILQLATGKGIEAKFSDQWHKNFLKRNSRLTRRASDKRDRKKARECKVESDESFIEILEELRRDGFLADPKGIINLDESPFILGFDDYPVYSEKGVKHFVNYIEGSTRDQVTALFCGDASEFMFKPLVLFDGTLHLQSWYENIENRVQICTNGSGTMDADILTMYFEKEILPNLTAKKSVVFMDGHHSHVLNAQLLRLCLNFNLEKSGKEVQLVCFPTGQTDKLQPLDNCPFGSMKPKWITYKDDSRIDPEFQVTKNNFPYHLSLLCNNRAGKHSFNFENTLKSGFKNTGIFPYDPVAIRATVDLNSTWFDCDNSEQLPTSEVMDDNNETFKNIVKRLEVNEKINSGQVAVCKKAIKSIASGGKHDIEQVIEAHGKAFTTVKPKKKRVLKDQRLVVDEGRILLKDDFMRALDDREVAKAAAKQKTKSTGGKTPKIPMTVRKRSSKKPVKKS